MRAYDYGLGVDSVEGFVIKILGSLPGVECCFQTPHPNST